MTRKVSFSLPSMKGLRARLVDQRAIREQLVSVAGLVGRPVELAGGAEVGRVIDVVTRSAEATVPHVSGLVVKIGRRKAFVPIEHVATLTGRTVTLSSSQFDVRDFVRRPGEVLLMGDVVDHQLVDIDGVQIVRASDLYIAPVGASIRVVGVETGLVSLLRRLGPRRYRSRATPERVIDWTDVQMVAGVGSVQLDRANRELRRLRPGDLADLLEQLGQPQRRGLVDSLDVDIAADALEEMESGNAIGCCARSLRSGHRRSSPRWSPTRPPKRSARSAPRHDQRFLRRCQRLRVRQSTDYSNTRTTPPAAS